MKKSPPVKVEEPPPQESPSSDDYQELQQRQAREASLRITEQASRMAKAAKDRETLEAIKKANRDHA